MARRAFLSTIPPAPLVPSPTPAPPGASASATRPTPAPPGVSALSPSIPAPPPSTRSMPIGRPSIPPPPRSGPPPSSGLVEGRVGAGAEGFPVGLALQLFDRQAPWDESAVQWLEAAITARPRPEASLLVRLLRAYREAGRISQAREFALSLPPAPSTWAPLDVARLATERAHLLTHEGRLDRAEAELRQASRALSQAAKGTAAREQLDVHLAAAQLELRRQRVEQATSEARLAEHLAERIDEGPSRATAFVALGDLAIRFPAPRHAAKHYFRALDWTAARSPLALRARGNLAIALACTGRVDEARSHAEQAIALTTEMAGGWQQADAYDVLALAELASDRPLAALAAIDEALARLGEADHPLLRYELSLHRTWALSALGQNDGAAQWCAKAERLLGEFSHPDPQEQQECVAAKARTFEALGQYKDALGLAEHGTRLPESFATGNLNVVLGRCAIMVGDEALARAAGERAALSGDRHGWVFLDRTLSTPLWSLCMRAGDSRVVRYAEKVLALGQGTPSPPPISVGPPSMRPPVPSAPLLPYLDASAPDLSAPMIQEGESLIYVTTPTGVTRVRSTELIEATRGATLVVDTITHALRIEQREVSLERRRALEPLVVQLLRRAREGLTAEEVLRAAGGPGPESADAEHRVRVLISRVRDLLGDASAIERVRDAGEHGKTRYRLAANVRFALVEPLSA